MTDRNSDTALREAKREYLERMLAEEGLLSGPQPIPRRPAGSPVPLTHAQEVLWLLDRATPGLIAYNSTLAFRLVGDVDLAAMEQALTALSARHESLRTRVELSGDHPVQVVDAPGPVALEIVDLRQHPADTRETEGASRLRASARRPFDLTRDHLLRASFVRLSDREGILMLLTHHIVSDAWSYGVIASELSALYAAARAGRSASLAEPSIQFGDYAVWERRELTGERLRERLGYWRQMLLPEAPALAVPTDRPRSPALAFEGGRVLRMLSQQQHARIKALAAAEGATLYMVLLAAFQATLHRWSGQDDIVTGSAIAGRTRRETEGLVGYFSAALPLRSRFSSGESFRTLLSRIRTTVLGALEHQDVPIEALVHELAEQGRSGHAPLFQCVLTMQENQGGRLELDGVQVTPYEVQSGTTKFELTLLPAERPDGLELLLWYRTDLFDQATAERFVGHVETLLDAAAADPTTTVDRLPLLTTAEGAELSAWNATSRDLGAATTMTTLIQRAATRAPAGDAVVSGDARLTWRELAQRGNQLAHRLRTAGVGPDVPVGLCFERSVEMIVGMYGILAAGGAYVPLLPDQPAARLAKQIEECGARVVVTMASHRALLPADVEVVSLDADAEALAAFPADAPAVDVRPEHLAYILFTSGSTGVPKGVAVTHANLVHYTRSIASVLGLNLDAPDAARGNPQDAPRSISQWHCATVSSLAADLGHTSVFPALASGGVLHVLPSDVAMDATRYQAYVTSHPIDLLKITPSHLNALLGAEISAAHLPAKWLVLGGEPCPWPLVERVLAVGGCRVLNHYGPTETTVGACTLEVGASDVRSYATVPIGRPLPNVSTHVLDRVGEPVPVGVPGELWIGGAGVARGYVNRDALTQERFATVDGERRYRTGDRVRRLPSGDIEFLGRLDEQVKVRGFRVELGEIEVVLARHPRVRQAVVALVDDQLVGYVLPTSENVDDSALAAHVAAELPDHMVPGAWVRLHTVPMNANGKVDRTALPRPTVTAATDDAPRSEAEIKLAALWAEVLKKDTVGVHENFFALGGHSLLAIRLLGRIAKTFGQRMSLRTLFENPTVAELATRIEA
ncbi:MAG TPA: amino acid adenylation domain-containing protein [Gemmatimonadaceae bacterium]